MPSLGEFGVSAGLWVEVSALRLGMSYILSCFPSSHQSEIVGWELLLNNFDEQLANTN